MSEAWVFDLDQRLQAKLDAGWTLVVGEDGAWKFVRKETVVMAEIPSGDPT